MEMFRPFHYQLKTVEHFIVSGYHELLQFLFYPNQQELSCSSSRDNSPAFSIGNVVRTRSSFHFSQSMIWNSDDKSEVSTVC